MVYLFTRCNVTCCMLLDDVRFLYIIINTKDWFRKSIYDILSEIFQSRTHAKTRLINRDRASSCVIHSARISYRSVHAWDVVWNCMLQHVTCRTGNYRASLRRWHVTAAVGLRTIQLHACSLLGSGECNYSKSLRSNSVINLKRIIYMLSATRLIPTDSSSDSVHTGLLDSRIGGLLHTICHFWLVQKPIKTKYKIAVIGIFNKS